MNVSPVVPASVSCPCATDSVTCIEPAARIHIRDADPADLSSVFVGSRLLARHRQHRCIIDRRDRDRDRLAVRLGAARAGVALIIDTDVERIGAVVFALPR